MPSGSREPAAPARPDEPGAGPLSESERPAPRVLPVGREPGERAEQGEQRERDVDGEDRAPARGRGEQPAERGADGGAAQRREREPAEDRTAARDGPAGAIRRAASPSRPGRRPTVPMPSSDPGGDQQPKVGASAPMRPAAQTVRAPAANTRRGPSGRRAGPSRAGPPRWQVDRGDQPGGLGGADAEVRADGHQGGGDHRRVDRVQQRAEQQRRHQPGAEGAVGAAGHWSTGVTGGAGVTGAAWSPEPLGTPEPLGSAAGRGRCGRRPRQPLPGRRRPTGLRRGPTGLGRGPSRRRLGPVGLEPPMPVIPASAA